MHVQIYCPNCGSLIRKKDGDRKWFVDNDRIFQFRHHCLECGLSFSVKFEIGDEEARDIHGKKTGLFIELTVECDENMQWAKTDRDSEPVFHCILCENRNRLKPYITSENHDDWPPHFKCSKCGVEYSVDDQWSERVD